jgi:hypothetical protein
MKAGFFTALILSVFMAISAHAAVFSGHSDVAVTTTSAQALAANQSRKYLLIQNKGTDSILVKFGSAHSASEGILISAGGYYEPFVAPIDAVFLKASSGTQTTVVVEGK